MKNEYVFPGLGEPKCQLFFDLQAYIAYNGGRLHLAEILESEMVKEYLPKQPFPLNSFQPNWTKEEVEYIMDNRNLRAVDIAEYLNRTFPSVQQKIFKLLKHGKIKKKPHTRTTITIHD